MAGFRIHLTDENGLALNLNGLNWTMTLCCFTQDNSNQFLTEYLKYSLTK
jgi:hypothetical protein